MRRFFAALLAVVMAVSAVVCASAELYPLNDAVGMSFMGFSTRDFNGNTVTSDIFSTHTVTVLNLWASWCTPCKAELPDFQTLHNYYQATPGADVQIWGVLWYDYWDEVQEAQQIVAQNGYNWGQMLAFPKILQAGQLLNPGGSIPVPETFIVDRNGIVRAQKRGRFWDYEEMFEFVSGWLEVLEAEESQVQVGDVDMNGVINANDALAILRMSLGLLPPCELALADVDGNGEITANDALIVMRMALGLIQRNDRGVRR